MLTASACANQGLATMATVFVWHHKRLPNAAKSQSAHASFQTAMPREGERIASTADASANQVSALAQFHMPLRLNNVIQLVQ